MSYKLLNNVKWYYYLKTKVDDNKTIYGLFEDNPRMSLGNKLVISWSYYDSSANTTQRLYAVFKNYIEFTKYMWKLSQHMRCFYELILGEYPQKPHFDLDLENMTDEKVNEVFNTLINIIIKVLKEHNINLDYSRDICIYSSHGGNKKSYHIVINHYCHANNKEAKAFYYEVIENLPKEYFENKWVDPAVYSETQQFRTFASQKVGTERTKVLNTTWYLNGEKIVHKYDEEGDDEKMFFMIQLEESLVHARTSVCTILPPFETPETFQVGNFTASDDITYEEAKEAMEMLAQKGNMTWDNRANPYAFDKIEGPFVVLKRMRPSRCKICYRIHHNQNPYLCITPDKNIYFHCRRAAKGKKWHIGKLVTVEGALDDEEVPKTPPIQRRQFTDENRARIKLLAEMANGPIKVFVPAEIIEANTNKLMENIKNLKRLN